MAGSSTPAGATQPAACVSNLAGKNWDNSKTLLLPLERTFQLTMKIFTDGSGADAKATGQFGKCLSWGPTAFEGRKAFDHVKVANDATLVVLATDPRCVCKLCKLGMVMTDELLGEIGKDFTGHDVLLYDPTKPLICPASWVVDANTRKIRTSTCAYRCTVSADEPKLLQIRDRVQIQQMLFAPVLAKQK